MLVNFVKIFGPFRECPLFPKAVIQIMRIWGNRRSAFGHKRPVESASLFGADRIGQIRLSTRRA